MQTQNARNAQLVQRAYSLRPTTARQPQTQFAKPVVRHARSLDTTFQPNALKRQISNASRAAKSVHQGSMHLLNALLMLIWTAAHAKAVQLTISLWQIAPRLRTLSAHHAPKTVVTGATKLLTAPTPLILLAKHAQTAQASRTLQPNAPLTTTLCVHSEAPLGPAKRLITMTFRNQARSTSPQQTTHFILQ